MTTLQIMNPKTIVSIVPYSAIGGELRMQSYMNTDERKAQIAQTMKTIK